MLALVFLMGIGPMLPWRRANWASIRRALAVPAGVGVLAIMVLLAVGLRKEYALAGFALAAFVATGILMEWYRGARARVRALSSGEPGVARMIQNHASAFVHLIWANRPRYGGYIVHLSVLMVALGIIGTSFFNSQKDVVLSPGETAAIENYEIRYVGTVLVPYGNRTEFVSSVEVYRDGEFLDVISPNRSFYPSFNMASTRAAIRSSPVEDFYVVPSENLPDGDVGFRLLVNPLIWWMWVAGPVMILGTMIALWPEPSRVTARLPRRNRDAGAPTTLPIRQ
jgi:cytochrome c-type biogenesis protein CcmF